MKRRLIAVGAILLILALVACSVTQLRPQQQASVTSTPTRTPKPTFTPTNTATTTLTPSPSPRPSNTPTRTPVPTNTPLPTDTPPPTLTPTITNTPRPSNTPTATRRPTARPTRRPVATATPRPTQPPPPPFTGTVIRGTTQCSGYRGVTGKVLHANGAPYPGVAVGVWSDAWQGRVSVSEGDGKYDLDLSNVPAGSFRIAVVRLETCGQRDGQPTAIDCQRISNEVSVTTTDNCTGADANQVTEVDFRGP